MKATFRKGAKLRNVDKGLQHPQKALRVIGMLMVAESQTAFKQQKLGKKKWSARATPNVYGIISDFAQGRAKPPGRRFESRPVLQDTGRLASSISYRVTSNAVEVGTTLDYSSVLQFGGKIESKTITSSMQKAMQKWLKRQSAGLRKQLGWLLNRKFTNTRLTGQVEARPFIGITNQTRLYVKQAVGVEIMRVQ